MIKLREFEEKDTQRLVTYLNDLDVVKYLSSKIPLPYTKADADWWINEGSKQDFVRAITINDELIGCIGVNRGEFEYNRSGEIGYWIGRDYWRQGFAHAALLQMTEIVFSTTNIVRIDASVFSDNRPSMNLLHKSGYQEEAILKTAMYKHGKFFDKHIFSRLKPD
ncbi:GNAT family N-acetyltransferase [Aliikangiella marina]|uniref:GNAT family N-acetyltransferase n=1 Tax=Aliikangiella marina TaxID=1712262 RepID=A0A545T908_9GAMM|nr:GNAT family protein [Aliikangiella marina]TQV73701.1 GNAT family N-acetyltransferase [Aliikangiella marina]